MSEDKAPQDPKLEGFFHGNTNPQTEKPKYTTPYIPPLGWRKYIGVGTVLFAILCLLTLSGGAILSPLIYAAGALFFMPIITRAPLSDGEILTLGPRVLAWIFILCVGTYFMPSTPETEAKTAGKPETTESPVTPAKTPSPSPSPTPTPTPAQTPESTTEPNWEKLSEEATALVSKTSVEWEKASDEQRLMAAGLMTYTIFKDKSKEPTLLKYAAQELVVCLNKMTESERKWEASVSEMATMCAMGMGWAKE